MSARVPVAPGLPAADAGERWVRLDECLDRAPPALHPWLAEPGLLTARVRRACGSDTVFRLLRLERAPLVPALARRMCVDDEHCLLREVEFGCASRRWIFAQSLFPDSTLSPHPWLADLGNAALGESLLGRHDVSREPLEYRELRKGDDLAVAAGGIDRPVWARRAVYQLSGAAILVQEVFLAALVDDGRATSRPGSMP